MNSLRSLPANLTVCLNRYTDHCMKLKELKATLALHPEALPRFTLPGGDRIPAHFHITEVGHIAKRFIDCGGKLHDKKETCLLQTYVASDVDHRLNAGTFAKIFNSASRCCRTTILTW